MADLYPGRQPIHPACCRTPPGTGKGMPKDRDQLTPDDPEDAVHLATHRGQGTAGTGQDLLPDDAGRGGAGEAVEAGTGAGEDEPAG
jgi:hypothetical protein